MCFSEFLFYCSPTKFGLFGYFGDCRRPRNRSLLNVNEDFEAEQDAIRANKTNYLWKRDLYLWMKYTGVQLHA